MCPDAAVTTIPTSHLYLDAYVTDKFGRVQLTPTRHDTLLDEFLGFSAGYFDTHTRKYYGSTRLKSHGCFRFSRNL